MSNILLKSYRKLPIGTLYYQMKTAGYKESRSHWYEIVNTHSVRYLKNGHLMSKWKYLGSGIWDNFTFNCMDFVWFFYQNKTIKLRTQTAGFKFQLCTLLTV